MFLHQRDGMLPDGTAVSVKGSGPAVVLLHGVGLRKAMWEAHVNVLAPHFTVVSYDLLGHGKSRRIDDSATLDDFVDQLVRVLDALGIDAVSLVGFSFGGLVAQGFACSHAGRLDRLVLMSTVYDRTSEETAGVRGRLKQARNEGPGAIVPAAIERWFSPAFIAGQPEVIGEFERNLKSNDAVSFLAAYGLFCDEHEQLKGCLKAVAAPSLVMTGELDTGSTPAMVERMVADLANGSGKIIDGGRHMMPIEMADEVAAVLVPFLADRGGE